MIGLEKETVCMNVDEAKEYVMSKIIILQETKSSSEERLSELNAELDREYNYLDALENPPSSQSNCCCDCNCDNEIPKLLHIARKSITY